MKVLLWSVASPFAASAYAKIARELAPQLVALGHQVDILAVAGLRWGQVNYGGVQVHGTPSNNVDAAWCIKMAKQLQADCVVYIGDLWPFVEEVTEVAGYVPLVIHSPIDHEPLVWKEAQAMKAAATVALPSRWSVEVCRKAGVQAEYLPHGVDLEVYRPYDGDRRELRRSLGWNPDDFVFLMVATNRGGRKNIPLAMRALAELPAVARDHRPVSLCLHTYPFRDQRNPDGLNLDQVALDLGIMRRIYWTEALNYLAGLPETEMARIYQASDVLLMPSKTEGFGLPIIEAGACGVPAIATEYASMPELVGRNRGWLVRVDTYEVEHVLDYAWMSQPALYGRDGLMQRMSQAMDDQTQVRLRGQYAREHAQLFGWDCAAARLHAVLQRVASSRQGAAVG